MFTAEERRALAFLAIVAAAGVLVRAARGAWDAAPGASVLPAQLTGDDVREQLARVARAESLARPLSPGERIDVDRAGPEELERLPRVGRAVAQRIVEDRASHGAFGGLEALGRVSGIGPATLRLLEPHVSFSGTARPVTGDGLRTDARAHGSPASCPGRVNPNTADAATLTCLPGVGPVLASRIVEFRASRGPFTKLEDLLGVPGLGARRLGVLAPLIELP